MTSSTLEPSAAPIPSRPNGPADCLNDYTRKLMRLTSHATCEGELLSGLTCLVQQYTLATGAMHLGAKGPDDILRLLPDPEHVSWKELSRPLFAACQSASSRNVIQIQRLVAPPRCIIATPIAIPGQPGANALAWVFPQNVDETVFPYLQAAVQAVAHWHTLAENRRINEEANEARAIIELFERISDGRNLQEGCAILASELKRYLQCKNVAVGVVPRPGRGCRLVALSAASRFDRRSSVVAEFEPALDEVALSDSTTHWSSHSEGSGPSLLAHRQLAKRESATSLIGTPLRRANGEIVGVILCIDPANEPLGRTERFLTVAGSTIANALACFQRLEGGMGLRLLRTAGEHLRRTRSMSVAATLFLGLALLAMPLPARIHCSCRIEPVTRRFVAAPFDGTLEKSFVEPSDMVRSGDLLARMDGREIRWRRASVEANLHQAEKKRDVAQASHNYAEQQISQLEMERLRLELELLDYRAENLEIRSPIDGVVVSGDWQRAQGAPFQVGQTLFEIGPLGKMVVEVAVPDNEISRVAIHQSVVIRLDAHPGKAWDATLARIEPRSEIRDEDNVFIGEAELENDTGLLRPGMKGQAKVAAGSRSLAWILFHKPWEYLVKHLSW